MAALTVVCLWFLPQTLRTVGGVAVAVEAVAMEEHDWAGQVSTQGNSRLHEPQPHQPYRTTNA